MKKFLKILTLFLFCLNMISQGKSILFDFKQGSLKDNLTDLWHYCKEWVEGDL